MTDTDTNPTLQSIDRKVDALREELAEHRQEERNNGARIDTLGVEIRAEMSKDRAEMRARFDSMTDLVVKCHTEVLNEIRRIRRGE